ncbi:hypothetical protein JK229_16190 [Pantoea dispersa]|uniref:hypothetical protein n=1 Tax=Pantoea dispersa TaxID=59814 RepID=UPI001BA68020|nr:hypothetical protein [Pantoea dispersa]MBS0906661.1 hypothetical protein [Pantoea dispersa]
MRDTLIITLMLIVILTFIPVSCFTGATLLALRQRKGWGWLIVAGVLTTVAGGGRRHQQPCVIEITDGKATGSRGQTH